MKTKLFMLGLIILAMANLETRAQVTLSDTIYKAFDGKGNAVTLDEIVHAMSTSDVVFLGEEHDDAVAHAIQAELFRRAVASYSPQRRVALSLEMFERDVQTVVDEYLKGLISEQHFLLSSRPWGNYKTDYRPLVELAKEKGLAVIAANAPRRYVNMVSRSGRDSLNGLSKEAKSWLAPLPYPEASKTYADKFVKLMSAAGDPAASKDPARFVHPQALWDATMADSIANYLSKNKGSLVVHLNGGFHTEGRLGTVEQLLHYRPKARVIVVTLKSEKDFQTFDPSRHTALGDFVVLTDASQPKSRR
ncbi:MAG: ChaN family lipoprotein [Pyrinomonadaceae bacterium]